MTVTRVSVVAAGLLIQASREWDADILVVRDRARALPSLAAPEAEAPMADAGMEPVYR